MNDMRELSKGFDHAGVDPKWYAFWESSGAFRADPASSRPPFSMVLPPPNVTGVLHIGHALNQTLPDIVCRWKRMTGHDVLCVDNYYTGSKNNIAGEAPGRRGDRPARARPGGVREAGVGVEPAEPRHHHESDAQPRVVGRLEPRALHPRRRPVAGGPAGVRDPLSRGADLSRQVHRELVHPVPDRAVRSRGGARGAGGPALSRALPGGRRRRRGYGRDHPAGDHGGGHRGGGASGRRAVPWPDRPDGAPAGHRPRAGGDRRRVRRRGVRDRRRQGDAGPRPQRLRDGPAARSAPGGGHRRGRPDDRRGGTVRRPGPVRGARGDRGAARGGGPAGTGRGPPACGGALQPLPDGGRAAGVDPVVRPDQAVGRARDCRGRGRPHPLRAGELGPHLLRVDDQHPRLVHLAPALVGAPYSRVVLRRVRRDDGDRVGAQCLRVRGDAPPGHRRPRHLVQLGALAVQYHGMA